MIKVGQIREFRADILIITHIGFTQCFGDVADLIYKDGIVSEVACDYLEKNSKLIAEYPTWQEAVNSKEFNDVAED